MIYIQINQQALGYGLLIPFDHWSLLVHLKCHIASYSPIEKVPTLKCQSVPETKVSRKQVVEAQKRNPGRQVLPRNVLACEEMTPASQSVSQPSGSLHSAVPL